MRIEFHSIGYVRTGAQSIPRHWTVSDVEGELVVHEKYLRGIKDITPGQRIVVIFYFHESRTFTPDDLVQRPPHHEGEKGVFGICSPLRPNPIGMSVLKVLAVDRNVIRVKGLDMRDGSPILDIKPYVANGDTA